MQHFAVLQRCVKGMKRGITHRDLALWPLAKLWQLLQLQTTGVHFVNGNLLITAARVNNNLLITAA